MDRNQKYGRLAAGVVSLIAIASAAVATAQDARTIGLALLHKHADCAPFEVRCTGSGTLQGPGAQAMQEIAEQVPRGGILNDPVDGSKLCIFDEGLFRTDGRDSYRSESTPVTGIRPSPDQTMYVVWSPEAFCRSGGMDSHQATYRRLSNLDPLTQLKAKQDGLATYEDERAQLGYLPRLRHVGELIAGLPDCEVRIDSAGVATVSSKSFGLRATIDTAQSRLLSVWTDRGGTQQEVQYGGWTTSTWLGFSHPGWERSVVTENEISQPAIVVWYSEPRRVEHDSQDQYQWQSVATSVFDAKNRMILGRDGTQGPVQSVQSQGIPAAPPVEVTDEGALRTKDISIDNRPVWAVGIVLVVLGGALWIRRAVSRG